RISEEEKYDGASAFALSYKRTGAPYVYTAKYSLSDACNVISFDAKGDGATGLILRFADATNAFVVSYDLSEVPAYWQHYEISLADPKWTVNGETSLSDYLAALEEDASALPAALASLRFLGEVIPSFDHVECVLSARTPAEEDAAFSLGSLTLLYREEPATLVTQPLFRKGSAYVLCEEVESGDEIYRNVVKLSFTDTTFLVFSTALKEAIYMEGTPSFDEAAATMSFASQDGASFLLSTYFEMNGELLKVESASGVGAKYLAGKTFRLAADDVFTFEDGEVNKPYLGEDWTAYNETSNGFKPFASTETQIFTSELLLDDPSAGEGEKSSKKVLTFATGAQQTNRFVFQRARSLGLTNSVALTFANAGEPFDAKIKVVGIDVSGEEYYFFGSEGKFGYADVTVRSGLFVAEKTLDADFDLVSLYLEVRNVSEREALRLSLAELAFSYEAEIEDVSLYSKPVITPEEGALSFSHAEYENAAFEYSFDKVNYISGSRYDIPVDASGDYTIWVRALIGEEERPSDLARFDYSVSPVTISNISVSIGEDGKHTAVWSTNGVSSVRVTETVEKKDQEGNALLDEGGNPIYEEVELSEYASITDCTASFDKNVTLYVSAAPLPYDPQKKLFYVGSVEAPPKKIRVDARLEAPVLFASADGDGIEWAPVDGAKWYSVQVGDFEPRMQEERFFAFQKSVGEYTVRVTSIDEDGIAYSNASEPYTYTVRAVTVKEFKVEETDFFAKVVAYRAFLKDSDKAEIELSLSLNDDGDLLGSYTAEGLGLHSVTLRIATGYDAENKILYILDPFLEEQLASGALSQDEDPRYAVGFVKIEPLDPPEILPNDAGDGLTWSTGWYNEAKYLLEVKYNDGEWQTLSDGSERVTDYLFSEREGHYVIRVKAIGNGKTLLSGPFTEYAFEIKTLSLEEIDYALEGPLDALLARVNITAVARLTEVKKGTDAYDGEPLSETADISVSAFGGYDLSTHIYYAGSNGKIEKSKEIIVPHYLAAPVLTDDAEGIYWTPVKDVDYYFVTVEKLDDEGSVISTRTAQIDTVKDAAGYAFYFERKNGVYQEGSYRVIVVSRNNKPAHYPSDYAAAVFTYRIRPVEIGDITVKGNTASWTYAALDLALAVKDALVDDSYPAYNKTSYTNPSSEDCAITLVATGGYDATRHILYVIPQGHPTNYVEKSCDIEYSQLLSPTLSVNAEETGLEWGAVTNATSFDVAVKAHGVLPEDTDYQNQTDMTYAFSSVVGKYDVYVKAVDRNTTIDDSEPAVFTYETIDVALSSITITETGKTTRRASWTKQGKTYVSTDGVDYARTEKTSFEPSEIPETTHYYLRCTAGFVSSGEHEGKYYYGETKETDALVIIPIFLSAPTLTLGESGVRVSAPDLRAEHFRVVLNGVAQENVALTASVI
ncbi:MAG: hypothetical protein J6Y74_04105, partial [Clostridia bacterium]|nr:hypothetical protein [Clostridia bacterium]